MTCSSVCCSNRSRHIILNFFFYEHDVKIYSSGYIFLHTRSRFFETVSFLLILKSVLCFSIYQDDSFELISCKLSYIQQRRQRFVNQGLRITHFYFLMVIFVGDKEYYWQMEREQYFRVKIYQTMSRYYLLEDDHLVKLFSSNLYYYRSQILNYGLIQTSLFRCRQNLSKYEIYQGYQLIELF